MHAPADTQVNIYSSTMLAGSNQKPNMLTNRGKNDYLLEYIQTNQIQHTGPTDPDNQADTWVSVIRLLLHYFIHTKLRNG